MINLICSYGVVKLLLSEKFYLHVLLNFGSDDVVDLLLFLFSKLLAEGVKMLRHAIHHFRAGLQIIVLMQKFAPDVVIEFGFAPKSLTYHPFNIGQLFFWNKALLQFVLLLFLLQS